MRSPTRLPQDPTPKDPPGRGRVRRPSFSILALLVVMSSTIGFGAQPVDRLRAQAAEPRGAWTTFANGDDVLSLALALDGSVLWSGTRSGGLVRWDRETGEYRQFLKPQDPLPDNTVHDIAVAPDGRLWLATELGLTVYDEASPDDPADDKWYTYTQENTAGGLPSNDLRAVAVSGELVWVGGHQIWNTMTGAWEGGGVGRLDTRGTAALDDDQWSEITTFAGTYYLAPDGSEFVGLVSDNINDIAVTESGDIWVATSQHWRLTPHVDPDQPPVWSRMHGGLSHLDTKGTVDGADDVWTGTSCQNMQLTVTCHVQAVAVDRFGFGWAAIQGRGVMFFDASRGLISDDLNRRVEMPDRVIGDTVQSIAFGPEDVPSMANTVWIGRSLGGVSVLDHRGTIALRGDDIWNFDRGYSFTTEDGLTRNRVQAIALGAGGAWLGNGTDFGQAGGICARNARHPPTSSRTSISGNRARAGKTMSGSPRAAARNSVSAPG
jgi:sugar lactone lactonase YvrE